MENPTPRGSTTDKSHSERVLVCKNSITGGPRPPFHPEWDMSDRNATRQHGHFRCGGVSMRSLLSLGVLLLLPGWQLQGATFRVTTKIFEGSQLDAAAEHVILFQEGLVYDFPQIEPHMSRSTTRHRTKSRCSIAKPKSKPNCEPKTCSPSPLKLVPQRGHRNNRSNWVCWQR